MECPVCFSCNKGAFILTNCGHNLCPECLVSIKHSNAIFRCPMCRIEITSKPVVIQAFADTMADGVVRRVISQVDSWFPEITHNPSRRSEHGEHYQPQHIMETLNHNVPIVPVNRVSNTRSLERAAECEYNAIVPEEHPVKKWNAYLSSMPAGSYFELAISSTCQNLEDGWSMYPFTNGPITITNWMTCLEKENNNSNHRRIVIFTGEKSSEIVHRLETKVRDFMHGKHPTMHLHSELRMRGDMRVNAPPQMSVGAHTGMWRYTNNNSIYTSQVTLACRGIWVKDNAFGCRWHIF
jgi:hypothetical protein